MVKGLIVKIEGIIVDIVVDGINVAVGMVVIVQLSGVRREWTSATDVLHTISMERGKKAARVVERRDDICDIEDEDFWARFDGI